MAVVEVAKIPVPKTSAREILATLCYYYPQYTFQQARRLPYKDVVLLIKTARRQEAMKYFNLTQISAAPHTKNGKGVTTLSERYKSEVSNG